MKRFKNLTIIENIMISSKNFMITKKNNNKKITIKFKACSFSDDKICFFIFRNKLHTKIKINVNKLFCGYFASIEKFNKNKIVNSLKIYNDLEKIFLDFDQLNSDNKIDKITELLDYIIVNRNYFSESIYTMDALKKKLVKLYYCNKSFKLLKYYYFLIFKVDSIKISNIKTKNFKNDSEDNEYSEDIDFELDNNNYKKNWSEIDYDLNFY